MLQASYKHTIPIQIQKMNTGLFFLISQIYLEQPLRTRSVQAQKHKGIQMFQNVQNQTNTKYYPPPKKTIESRFC